MPKMIGVGDVESLSDISNSSSQPKTFPLLRLPPILLKLVIEKLEPKSYVRLQQTCRLLEEFIQINPIQMYVKKGCTLEWKRDDDGNLCVEFTKNSIKPSLKSTAQQLKEEKTTTVLDFESLYGLRLKCIVIESNSDEDIDKICKILKKYRITTASMYFTDSNVELTTEDCAELLRVLKPSNWINLFSYKSNQWKAVLSYDGLPLTLVTVHPRDLASTARELVPRLPAITLSAISADDWEEVENEEVSNSIISMLELLLVPRPHLQLFGLRATLNRPLAAVIAPVFYHFRSSNPSVTIDEGTTYVEFKTLDCKLGYVEQNMMILYENDIE